MITFADIVFHRSMKDAHNLIGIHKLLNEDAGRRVQELSLNRAAVVMTVAAWQAYVQDLVRDIVDYVEIPFGQEGHERFRLIKMDALSSVSRFSTPNADNTRRLLLGVGFDPAPHWTWQQGPLGLTETETKARMDEWLRVRHAIAHGHEDLPDVSVLTHLKSGGRSIQRHNAESCISFFNNCVRVTTMAAEAHFE